MTSFAANSVINGNPDAKLETKLHVVNAYYGPIVRQNDFELRQWINTWLFINNQNGTLARIYSNTRTPTCRRCRRSDTEPGPTVIARHRNGR